MRIISGKHKGRILCSFEGSDIRPTADRAKEALFNIYKDRIAGKTFLDLFCGSGNVGIEALSRGAAVTLVDNSVKSVELSKKNLALIKENCEVVLCDALEYLRRTDKKFDYIFIDPPYAADTGLKALSIIGERNLLNDGGVAVYERDGAESEEIKGLYFIASRRYGKACFNIDENRGGVINER